MANKYLNQGGLSYLWHSKIKPYFATKTEVNSLKAAVGSPLKAGNASDMIDTNRVYVYTGNESGYISGNWYYYDGTAWVSGGVYNSVAVETDKTLEISDMAADSAIVGAEIGSLKSELNDPTSGLDSKAPAIYGTASGAIASFPDGADGVPLKKLTINIEPVQSGSGDPSPEDNVRPISGWTGVTIFDDPEYAIKLHWNQLAQLDESAWSKTRMAMSITENVISIHPSSSSSVKKIWFSVQPNHAILMKGTLLGESNYGFGYGIYNGSAGNDYKQRNFISASGTDQDFSAIMSTDDEFHDFCIAMATAATTENNAIIANLQVFDLTDMFGAGNEPSTVEEFEEMFPADYYDYNAGEESCVSAVNGLPYRKWDVSWETEAGTVYGGTLDVTTGVLTVDTEIRSFNGSNITDVSGSSGYAMIRVGAEGYIKYSTSCLSNRLVYSTKTAAQIPPGGFAVINSAGYNRAQINIKLDLTSETKAEQLEKYKAQLDEWDEAGTPLQVMYYLSTPRVYQLTPQQVMTMLGQNNVWADCGDVDVGYVADTKLYIQHFTDPDDDMIADNNIESGNYFVVGNRLYLSTAAISQGETIVPGTNCEQTNIADALNALNK